MPRMHPITLAALEAFPREFEKHYAAFPAQFVHWAPPSWDGVPSEPFTAIEQICHVRDIEIEGMWSLCPVRNPSAMSCY